MTFQSRQFAGFVATHGASEFFLTHRRVHHTMPGERIFAVAFVTAHGAGVSFVAAAGRWHARLLLKCRQWCRHGKPLGWWLLLHVNLYWRRLQHRLMLYLHRLQLTFGHVDVNAYAILDFYRRLERIVGQIRVQRTGIVRHDMRFVCRVDDVAGIVVDIHCVYVCEGFVVYCTGRQAGKLKLIYASRE